MDTMLGHGQQQRSASMIRKRRRDHVSVQSQSSLQTAPPPSHHWFPSTHIPRARASLQPILLLPLPLLLLLSLSLTPSPSHALRRISLPIHRLHYPQTLHMPTNNLRGPTPRLQQAGRRFPQSTVQYNDAGALNYYWGSLMVYPAEVYLVYYGNWSLGTNGSRDSGQRLVRSFIDSFNASAPSGPGSVAAWWRINSLYAQADGSLVSHQVVYGGEAYDSYSQGTVLTDDTADTQKILRNLFNKGALPAKSRAYYAILTSPDVQALGGGGGFCDSYCGWHDLFTYTPKKTRKKINIYYAFVGNPATQCLDRCPTLAKTPNPKFPGVDIMIDTLGHELSEIATDPDTLTGWLTSNGSAGLENGDLCRRNFLTPRVAGKGRNQFSYTLTGPDKVKFLVQSNYDPVQAKCVMYA